MLRISNKKLAQSYLNEISDVDWFDDPPDEFDRPGFINNENYPDYLADELDNEGEKEEPEAPQKPPSVPHETPAEQGPKPIEYENATKLVKDGIANLEVISFDYTNRYGMYSGYRTVEPHYIFLAKSTGNLVLVSWDLDKIEPRAFIMNNVHPYGVRYEGQKFVPRPEIMAG